jgi:5-methylcytosine-specific restriction protein A
MFKVNNVYSKKDIYSILKVPERQQRGAWDTGYRIYQNDIFIFANIGIPGRDGSDYNNHWDGDLFVWEAKGKSKLNQPLMQKMVAKDPSLNIFLFTRTDNAMPFTYEGNVVAKEVIDDEPIKIIWHLREEQDLNDRLDIYEGTGKQVTNNKFERNPLARRLCIDYYGWMCNICDFDFYKTYGELGKYYIHVHHLVPLHKIRELYRIDPIADLIPICPNCHMMVHRTKDLLSPMQLRQILNKKNV